MEKTDIVKKESNDIEDTPLASAKDGEMESSCTKSSLSPIASELTLENVNKIAPTTIDGSASDQTETFTSESNDTVEATITDVVEETNAQVQDSQDPPFELQASSETEPLQESQSENPCCRRWLWQYILLKFFLEALLLALPISMIYFGIAYVNDCESGNNLPVLLIVWGVFGILTVIGRILISVMKKLPDFNIFPPKTIYSLVVLLVIFGVVSVVILYIVELFYVVIVDSALCSKTFYQYIYGMTIFAAFFAIYLLLNTNLCC